MVKNLKKIVSIFLSTAMLSAYTGGVLAAEETAVGYAYLDLGEY